MFKDLTEKGEELQLASDILKSSVTFCSLTTGLIGLFIAILNLKILEWNEPFMKVYTEYYLAFSKASLIFFFSSLISSIAFELSPKKKWTFGISIIAFLLGLACIAGMIVFAIFLVEILMR